MYNARKMTMELTQGVRFDTLELSPEILRALMERNIIQSTPVQAGCIPPCWHGGT